MLHAKTEYYQNDLCYEFYQAGLEEQNCSDKLHDSNKFSVTALQTLYQKTYCKGHKLLDSRSGQTVQPQIRLLLEEQSDQSLHLLQFHLHLFDEIPQDLASLFEF